MKTRIIFSLALLAALCQSLRGQGQEAAKPVRPFQLSLVPMVGTDGAAALQHQYRVSLNLIAGITGGVQGVELGGLLNITTGDVLGLHLAGFGNVVSGNHQGFIGAGFINVTGGHAQGFIGAGFANVTGGHAQGFAGAGFANVTGGSHEGFAGAGFANVTGGSAKGFLGAGFGNFTGNRAEGAQFAGFINKSGDMKGIQASGFINIARKVEGIQLGVINVADTIAGGVPIGLASFVRRGGLMQLELAGSDVQFLSVSFRTGIPRFYNIFSFGMRPFSDEQFNSLGMGLGTSLPLGSRAALQLEGHAWWLQKPFRWRDDELDLLGEFRLLGSIKVAERLELFAGPVYYRQVSRRCDPCGPSPRNIAPERLIRERTAGDYTSRCWLGVRGGLRICIR